MSKVIRDNQVRAELLPTIPDDRLAMIVRILDEKADREFVAFNGWESNYWHDPEVQSFLDRFPDPAP